MFSSSAPLPAKIFGFSGLAPFLILALSAWIFPDPYRLLVFDILVHYAAVILSFVGAVYWGLALCNFNNRSKSEKQMWIMFGWSIIPAVMAWIATQMVLSAALLVLILGFVSAFIFDLWSGKRKEIPLWYLKLRKSLTLVVVITLSSALLQSMIA
jgi:hypothetical protein